MYNGQWFERSYVKNPRTTCDKTIKFSSRVKNINKWYTSYRIKCSCKLNELNDVKVGGSGLSVDDVELKNSILIGTIDYCRKQYWNR